MIVTVALMRHGGSHLIRPIVDRIIGGGIIREPGKKWPLDRAEGPVIVFLRDPRDRMVATYRWWMAHAGKAERLQRAAPTVDGRIAWLLVAAEGGFLKGMRDWAKVWCPWRGALTVRFEDVRRDGPAEIRRIAEFLGVADVDADALFAEVYGKAHTYTGRHSDWRKTFGPASNAAWASAGGPDLLRLMGYGEETS